MNEQTKILNSDKINEIICKSKNLKHCNSENNDSIQKNHSTLLAKKPIESHINTDNSIENLEQANAKVFNEKKTLVLKSNNHNYINSEKNTPVKKIMEQTEKKASTGTIIMENNDLSIDKSTVEQKTCSQLNDKIDEKETSVESFVNENNCTKNNTEQSSSLQEKTLRELSNILHKNNSNKSNQTIDIHTSSIKEKTFRQLNSILDKGVNSAVNDSDISKENEIRLPNIHNESKDNIENNNTNSDSIPIIKIKKLEKPVRKSTIQELHFSSDFSGNTIYKKSLEVNTAQRNTDLSNNKPQNSISSIQNKKVHASELVDNENFTIDKNALESLFSIQNNSQQIINDVQYNNISEPIGEVGVGYILDDRYILEQLLSSKSGEAEVYKCKVKGLNSNYVAKIYYPKFQPNDEIIEKTVNRLNSEYVVKLNMVGFINTNKGRRFYEIMPYYSAGTLEERSPMSEREIIEKVIPSINEGLRAIHRIGIIHRDLKPNNLFIEVNSTVVAKKINTDDKLLSNESVIIGDFGISSSLKENQTHRKTSASRTLGYGAPETITENLATYKSDYFSLGITLLTLLVGKYPYNDEVDMVIKIRDGIYNFPEHLSSRMQDLLVGLIQYDRDSRWGYEEVKEWADDKSAKIVKKQSKSLFKNVVSRKPYEFRFNKYFKIVDLVEAMASDWDYGKTHVQNGLVAEHFRGLNRDLDIIFSELEVLLNRGADSDTLLLSLIYSINPYFEIYYKDNHFIDFEDMGNYILENTDNIDAIILEMLKTKKISSIYKLKNKFTLKQIDNEYLQMLQLVESMSIDEPELAYYLFGLKCSSFDDKDNILKYIDNERFNNLDYLKVNNLSELYTYFHKLSKADATLLSDLILNKPIFYSWLYYTGNNEIAFTYFNK